MNSILRFIIAFLALTGAVALATTLGGVEFGRENFWDFHGLFFLACITVFPRLTLLLSSVAWGGLLWWLGWIFAPRILVAVLATLAYWHANPILVLIAWFIAVGGESSEKYWVVRRVPRPSYRTARSTPSAEGPRESKWVKAEVIDPDR